MLADLHEVLGSYPIALRPLKTPQPMPGGLSGARLWRLDTALGPKVVRAWPPGSLSASRLDQIHRWLGEVADLGFVPLPEPTASGRTWVECSGRYWEVSSWRPGSAELGPQPSMERVQAALTALAAFHQRLARHAVEGPSPGLAHRLQELRDLQAGGFDALERILTARREIPGLELVRRWLEQARSLAPILIERTRRQAGSPIPLQPCVRDARPEHFLFEANRLTGLVDFGAMDLDSVAADLSRLLAEWFGPERKPRVEALAAYTAIRPLSSVEVSLIDTYEHATALLIGARWTRWAVLEGRGFDPSGTIQDRIGRSLDRLSRFRELQWST